LKGLGIRELRDDFDRDTYRVVYTVTLANAVYVLHAFKKKSKFGISTPRHDIDLVLQRYHEAVKLDAASQSPSRQDTVR
jgi:phage-related protein